MDVHDTSAIQWSDNVLRVAQEISGLWLACRTVFRYARLMR